MGDQPNIHFQRMGERTLLVEWPANIDPHTLQQITGFQAHLENHPIEGVVEWNTGYSSLAVRFDPDKISMSELESHLKKISIGSAKTLKRNRWTLPVYYHPSIAPDLNRFCKKKKMSIEEVISLHSSRDYLVYFLGFLPGFMYLGGLDEALHVPRKEHPDRSIPKGSVAIGGKQTGIYPSESPGGWHVIGNCPVTFFNTNDDPPCPFQAGDTIVFTPIEKKEFLHLASEVDKRNYHLKPESI